MGPTRHALLVCVVFLCGLQETVLSQRGRCTGNHCFALFQRPSDFPDAQKSCEEYSGQLFVFSLEPVEQILRGISGSYWLEPRGAGRATEEAAVGRRNCSSISVREDGNFTLSAAPCSEDLDGFLCQYEHDALCSGLKAGGGAKVKYASFISSDVSDWESFPAGTTAVVEKVGSEYPDSRHLCFSSIWVPAPWSCEVMGGGCDHSCNSATQTCTCPAGQVLHPNRITCIADPCAACAHHCQQEGDTRACTCRAGHRLAQDGVSCVDVNECEEASPCTGVGEECMNTQGGFECVCRDGFDMQDGVCEDFSRCQDCEHMLCEKINGVYGCACRKGFRVVASDPTKCEQHCPERDCLAACIQNHCFCPNGYIKHKINGTHFCTDIDECEMEKPCDHKCENLLGSYRCLCDEGFRPQGEACVPAEEEEDDGSGSTPPYPTAGGSQPLARVPPYIKTGSILGIAVFLALCATLLYFLLRNATKRCGRFELSSLKNPDIFYLQQVTTETYKRMPFDKQFRNDAQIL